LQRFTLTLVLVN